MADLNSTGLCQCGCGQPAPIAKKTYRKIGHIAGKPVRFIVGHHKKTHGYSRTSPTYGSWSAMLSRCTNPNASDWPRYGGRGITVCEKWLHSFECFLRDMGDRPPDTTLDRYPNNDGNYEPGNCRWATATQQSRNRRSNHPLEFNGKTQTIAEWAEELGLNYTTLDERIIRSGWSVEKALTTPHRERFIRYNGKTLTLKAWSKALLIPKSTLDWRLRTGWPIEKALGTPSRKKS